MDHPSGLLDPVHHRFDQFDMAANQVPDELLLGRTFAGGLHPHQTGPHVRRRRLVEGTIELGGEHRPPQLLVHTFAAETRQPLADALTLQQGPITDPLRLDDGPRQPCALDGSERREAQEIHCVVHRVDLPAQVEAGTRFMETEPIGNVELFTQFADVHVARQDGVVEAVDQRAIFQPNLPRQAAQARGGLEDFDLDALPDQEVTQGDPHDPTADDRNLHDAPPESTRTGSTTLCLTSPIPPFRSTRSLPKISAIRRLAVPSPKIAGRSGGGVKSRHALKMRSGSVPTTLFQPISTVSIHSVSSRSVRQGTPRK